MDREGVDDLETAMYEALVPGEAQIKVALLIIRTFGTDDLPAATSIDAALERLAARDDVAIYGLIKHWRRSEIMRLSASRQSIRTVVTLPRPGMTDGSADIA